MTKSQSAAQINRTKFYRPPVTADYIHRDPLYSKLEHAVELPLTIVSAPAGYGKSTLISHLLESSSSFINSTSTWLSLDESDSDLRIFLHYFVTALRMISADACAQTLSLVNSESLPPLPIIATQLSNDLDELSERLILVLDDYHRLSNNDINTILDKLLEHPPQNLHLIIISRRDPALALASLRAQHLLSEIRVRDLKFSSEDTLALLAQTINHPLQVSNIQRLQDSTEGWPVGIRLAALALEHQNNVVAYLNQFSPKASSLQEYLITEVLSVQPTEVQNHLLNLSILDRFNVSLCEAICNNKVSAKKRADNGQNFIKILEQSGLFCIALDGQDEWFRFHHMFADLLRKQLEERCGKEEKSRLHRIVSHWFEKNNYIEEAIHHSLEADDMEAAIEILGSARQALMNKDQWHRLERWLNLFPHKIVQQYTHLILLRCWLDLYHWYRLDYLVTDLEQAEVLLKNSNLKTHKLDPLKAEVAAIRSNLAYWILKPSDGITLAEQVLHDSPDAHECVRSTALLGWSPLHQMLGELKQGERVLWNHMEDGRFNSPNSRARLIQSLCLSYWPEADTRKLYKAASSLLELSIKHELPWSQSFARYFLGLIHYERNELNEAVAQFEIIVGDPYHFPIQNWVHCSFLQSLSYQALGQFQQAQTIADSILQLTFERGNTMFIDLAEAFQARLDLHQGRIAQASQWSQSFQMPAPHALQRLFNAEQTYICVLMAENTPQSRKTVAKHLDSFHTLLNQIHHPRLLIDILGLKALLADSEGDSDTAVTLLHEAVALGQASQLIRPLADLGTRLIKLLNRLDMNQEGLQYIGMILSALGESTEKLTSPTKNQALIEALSHRELEVLKLFAKNLSNNAIAEQLFISTGTVKRHAHNIYTKLSVSSRHDAVSKAMGLGILSTT